MFATLSPEHSFSMHENPVIQRTYNLSVLNANQTDDWSSAANCLVLNACIADTLRTCIYKTTPHYQQWHIFLLNFMNFRDTQCSSHCENTFFSESILKNCPIPSGYKLQFIIQQLLWSLTLTESFWAISSSLQNTNSLILK